jgi:hypothetical protein
MTTRGHLGLALAVWVGVVLGGCDSAVKTTSAVGGEVGNGVSSAVGDGYYKRADLGTVVSRGVSGAAEVTAQTAVTVNGLITGDMPKPKPKSPYDW